MADAAGRPRNFARVITSDRIHRLGGFFIRVALAGFLGMLWLLELIGSHQPPRVYLLIPGLAGIALVLFAEAHVPTWVVPVAGLSLAATTITLLVPQLDPSRDLDTPRGPGFAEMGAFLILVIWAVRRWDFRFGKTATVLVVTAMLVYPLRLSRGPGLVMFEMLMITMVTAALGLGIYLRSTDVRRRNALSQVRRGERLDLARDLHDFVAHHVTGIVVQAQAAQYIAEADPQRSRQSFAEIEKAGMEALSSMRRLVAVLREEDAGAGARPLGDLDQVVALTEGFSVGDSYCSLYVSPDLQPQDLPPEIATTAHRVVQEALTNVRKHAPATTTVAVAITKIPSGIEVAVRDGGRRSARNRLATSGGGFGLAGLAERVSALGGALAAGPRPEGGWEVVARLPLAGSVPIPLQEQP